MGWVYVDLGVTKDMLSTCTCMHLHAPEASDTRRNVRGVGEVPPHTPSPSVIRKPKPKTYTYKTLRLEDLPSDSQWWADRQKQFPGVNLIEELDKAKDWPKVHQVKNAKLFFRRWLTKAQPDGHIRLAPSLADQLAALKR